MSATEPVLLGDVLLDAIADRVADRLVERLAPLLESPTGEPAAALSVEDAAMVLGISERTITRLISAGHLTPVSIGRRRLVTAESVRKVAAQGAPT
jgi:excisionase family DNA binding protein